MSSFSRTDCDDDDDDEPPWLENKNRTIFITRQIRYFEDDYIKEDCLGEGTFGICYKCYKRGDIKKLRPFAVKEIYKSRLTVVGKGEKDSLLLSMQNEIAILLKVRHKNIVKLFDVYESRDQLHLVMEYCDGGELYDRICKDEYGEKQAVNIIKQILNSLNIVHSKKICHLDLKPENILFKDKSDDCVKLIDFGMSRMIPRLTLLKGKKIGTIQYMAPEIISGKGFGLAADVWSVGVILYCMLFGYPPFFDDQQDDDHVVGDMVNSEKIIENKILNGFNKNIRDGYGPWFPSEIPISNQCMKLISNMLEIDVTKRWTVKECLSCKWIQQQKKEEDYQTISPLFRESLLKYTKKNKFRVAISNLFSDYLDIDIKQEIIRHFKEMDIDNDGKLSLKEFELGLKKLNDQISNEQIEKIFKCLDFNNDFKISLNELIISTNMTSLVSRDERLYAAFQKLDTNHDGRIDKKEMENAARKILNVQKEEKKQSDDDDDNKCDDDNKYDENNMITLKRLKSAFDEVDSNNDGTIDYDEFLKVLHPEFESTEDSFTSLQKMKSIENSYDSPFFNVTNKFAKGLLIQPEAYNNYNNNNNKQQPTIQQENNKLKQELKNTKNILSKNMEKVYNLQNDLKQKDKTIASLSKSLNERNVELKRLRELLKSLQSQQ